MTLLNVKKRSLLFVAVGIASGSLSSQALSQGVNSSEEISEITITGSRRSGMAVVDSPAPIQMINSDSLKESGAPDLMNSIATQVPSYNASQVGTDMANQTLSASMRALSANHVLVLVNGKRRHITSNVDAVLGSSAADLSFIPTSGISRVEVLTDGAAAIYGSDAIAGVINIILKEDNEGGSINTTVSEYADGGGFTTLLSGDIGFGTMDSYLNLSIENEQRETVLRNSIYGPAECVADPDECINRLENGTVNGYRISSDYWRYLERDRKMASAPGFPELNNWGSPPDISRTAVFFNAGHEFSSTLSIYGYGGIAQKTATSLQVYRRPSLDGGFDENGDGDFNDIMSSGLPEYMYNKYEFGFTPEIETEEDDYSLTVGVNGENDNWTWDLASSYGFNDRDIFNNKSMNFAIWNETGSSQEDFYIGRFEASQWTTSFDASKEFEVGMSQPMTFATGVEYRVDKFGIHEGEPNSYYGAGASGFPGYQPNVNTGTYDRNNLAGYLNLVFVPTDNWVLDAAVRHEKYSDFGSKTIGKITSRYDITDSFAVRGTISTGFRAPTLGEGYYSAVIVSQTSATPQLQANSPAAAALGFGDGLQPETSESISFGLVFEPLPGLTTTIDAYEITISDRIQRGLFNFSTTQSNNTLTGRTTGSFDSTLPDPADTNGDGVPDAQYNEALGRALVGFGYIGSWNDPLAPGGSLDQAQRASVSVAIFNNSLDTKTTGVDWVSTYVSRYNWGSINWTAAANYNKTEVLRAKAAPASLGGAVMYSPQTLSNMETNSPEYRVNLSARINWSDFTLNVRHAIYGPQYTVSSTSGLPGSVVDQLDTVMLSGRQYYKSEIGVMHQTSAELSYNPTDALTFSVGVDNLFNVYPDEVPGPVYDYNAERYVYANRKYLAGSPVGFFGARWFGKLTYNF